MADEFESPEERQAKNRFIYDKISERLSPEGGLKLVDESVFPLESKEKIAAETLNKITFKLGALIDEIAFQAAEISLEDKKYERALPEAQLLAEFLTQLVEQNPKMNVLEDKAKEQLYRKREDNVRFWLGDFEFGEERVDFNIMARPETKERFSVDRPGQLEESRQARISINLQTMKHNINIRIDPDIGNLCFDVETPVIPKLSFDNVGQARGHHFKTDMRVPTTQFADTIKLFSEVIDTRVA